MANASPARPAMTPRVALNLSHIALLRGLSAAEQALLRPQLKPREITDGDVLDVEAELDGNVYFVWSGVYRLAILSPAGAHVTIRTLRAGDQLIELAALPRIDFRSYSLIADEGGTLLEMPASAFFECVARMPALARAALGALARTAATRAERIFEFATLDVKQRLQAELLRLAQGGVEVDGEIVISPAPTQESIATQIGASREGITRHLKVLESQGLLKRRRRNIVILDPRRLRALVERDTGLRPSLDGVEAEFGLAAAE